MLLPVDYACFVAHNYVARARRKHKFGDSRARGSRAAHRYTAIGKTFVHDFKRVETGGKHHYGGAVLVVVKNGYIEFFFQLFFYFKAARRGNILQIYSAEAARKKRNGGNYLVDVLARHAQRNRVHSSELLEQHAFALHDGHTRERSDIAKPEHRASVRDHSHGVEAARQGKGLFGLVPDFQTRLRHSRRIGKRQIRSRCKRHSRNHFYFAPPQLVHFKRLFHVIHFSFSF